MAGHVKNDPLFIGLTRPAMLLGASFSYTLFNMTVSAFGFLMLDNIYFLIAAIPIQGIGYQLCSKEPLIIELMRVRLSKCSRAIRNRLVHGANSYDPF